MVEKVHEHGALAGIQLWHGGASIANLFSREAPLGAESGRAIYNDPVQSRIVNKSDIKEIRRWFVAAARRGKAAGFDIIYMHDFLIHSFLSSNRNFRSDEYGGSVENRVRVRVPNDDLYYGFDEPDPGDVPFKREINVLGL